LRRAPNALAPAASGLSDLANTLFVCKIPREDAASLGANASDAGGGADSRAPY